MLTYKDYNEFEAPEGHHLEPVKITKSVGDLFNDGDEYFIEINEDDYPIPHFHLYNKDKSFHTCIRIFENMYCIYNNKYNDILTSNQCKQLNDYLKEEDPKYPECTNWYNIMCFSNSLSYINYPTKTEVQPDYEKLTLFSDDKYRTYNIINGFPHLKDHEGSEFIVAGFITFKRKDGSIDENIGKCIVVIFIDDHIMGHEPHFHIYNKDLSFNACIKIYENKYYNHFGKYTSTLKRRYCKQLDNFLRSKYYGDYDKTKVTIWEHIKNIWEYCDGNRDNYFNIPKYGKLSIAEDTEG